MTTNVTTSVVFTDLVGSTELSSRLGPPAAEDVRAIHFGLLRDAVAATGGQEVKNLGDGLMVVFPSLGAALDGAVAMQQSIERYNQRAAEPLGIRVGLSSGDTTEADNDFFGEPVVEAARLCAKASGGQIVTTETVRLLARRTHHRFLALGTLELKGLPEPIEAYEVAWAPIKTAAQVPLPSRLSTAPTTGVVGRALELENLSAALKAVFTGEGHRVVLLSGEPGVGKSTLAGDVAERAHSDGATVLYGRCDEDIGVPYQPFVEALGGYVAGAPEAVLRALDARQLRELSRLVPEVRRRIPELAEPLSTDADAERYILFGAITAVLTEMGSVAPVIVVLDDLHWADKPTVLLLRHLVSTLGQAEVFVVGTYRDSDLTATQPLTEGLAVLRRESAVERIAVGGLDDNGVVALLEAIAGHEMDDDGIELAHAVRRETGGNPFFSAEVLRHLADTGAIRREAGRWVGAVELASVTLPASVREVVGERVQRLGDDIQQILTVASVMGREFDLALLARAADRNEDDVLDALEAAARAEVLAEVDGRSGRFTFTHALFQHTLYDTLSASRRARTHRRIGELLEADCGDDPGDRVGELAYHWMAATQPTEAGKAATYARRAGERALDALAPDEAIRWFLRAVEILDAEPQHDPLPRLDVLIGLGDAQRQAGDPGYRETLLEAAAEADRLGDAGRLVAAAIANNRGRASSIGEVDAERVAALESALAAVDDGDSPARAWLLATLVAELPFSGDQPRVQAIATDAESMARRLGDEATLLRVLNLTFRARWLPDGFARTVAASREALTLAERAGDPVARFWAALNCVYATASDLDRGGIDAALELATAMAHEIGQPYLAWQLIQVQCPHVLLTGDADQADRLAGEALELGLDSGQPDALTIFGANLMNVRWHQGRFDEIVQLVAQAAEDNPGIPTLRAAHALSLCESGRTDEARPLLEAARREDFDDAARDYLWLTMTTLWADTAAWLGDQIAAEVLHRRLAPFEAQGVTTGASFSGSVAMYLARLATVLARHDEAEHLFERADAQMRALRAPFLHARNQVEWARALIARASATDVRRARDLLTEAGATAVTYGCRAIEQRATDLIATLPESPH